MSLFFNIGNDNNAPVIPDQDSVTIKHDDSCHQYRA